MDSDQLTSFFVDPIFLGTEKGQKLPFNYSKYLKYTLRLYFSSKVPFLCNDPFSLFEQQTSILEKLAEATDPTTERHGHDGPSQGLVSKHLGNLKLRTENRLSELCDGMAGRTVTGVTDRHSILGENKVLDLTTT